MDEYEHKVSKYGADSCIGFIRKQSEKFRHCVRHSLRIKWDVARTSDIYLTVTIRPNKIAPNNRIVKLKC